MKELCIPIPYLKKQEIADVEVTIAGIALRNNIRMESFLWEPDDKFATPIDPLEKSLARIYKLKNSIENYVKEWGLIQIFNTDEHSDHIPVL